MIDVLEAGTLTRATDGASLPFAVRLLGPEHLDELVALQRYVVDTLEDEAFYYPLPPETLALSLGERGMTAGTFVDGTLVGFRSILYPAPGDENLGEDIGLPPEELGKVAHLERTVVHPDFRGNRLQKRMTAQIIKLAADTERWRHLLSTVAPTNYASMKDKFVCGMLIVRLSRKYAGYWRYVFYQDVITPIDPDLTVTETLEGSDVAGQRELLGHGYFGCEMIGRPGAVRLRFARAEL